MASTRLILAHDHEGTVAAGHVVEAFDQFVMAGNFIIGVARQICAQHQAPGHLPIIILRRPCSARRSFIRGCG